MRAGTKHLAPGERIRSDASLWLYLSFHANAPSLSAKHVIVRAMLGSLRQPRPHTQDDANAQTPHRGPVTDRSTTTSFIALCTSLALGIPAPALAQTPPQGQQQPEQAQQAQPNEPEGPKDEANQAMEGLQIDPDLRKARLTPTQIGGWSLILSSIAVGVGSTLALNAGQNSESKAQRILRTMNPDRGAHPLYREVRSEYDAHLNRAASMRSLSLALSLAAGAAMITGVALAIAGAKKPEPRPQARLRGLSFRF